MCNVFTNIKRIVCFVTFIACLVFCNALATPNLSVAYAKQPSDIENEYNNVLENTLDDIDSGGLDDYLSGEITSNLFDVLSFKEIVKLILNGELFSDYDSLSVLILQKVKSYFLSSLKIIVMLLAIIVLYKLFESFCANKYIDVKKIVKTIFILIIVYILTILLKDLIDNVKASVSGAFSFCEILFPILLSLVLASGASVSFASYNSLSVILLQTFSYVFVYVLIPLAASIMVFSLVSFISSKNTLSNVADLLKSLFKYVITIMVAVFGICSSVAVVSAGMKDGISLKFTKYAIKNYVPVLGGYISEGFDFVKSSSVVIKNAFGLGGVVILFFNILSPVIVYISYVLVFKILSIIVSFLDEDKFSKIFNGVAKSISYFITVLVGLFLILTVFIYMVIISVSVV